MRKTIEEVVGAIEELYASGKYDAEFRKKLITNSLQARDEALLAELEEGVRELGHQQDDDTIWCNMDSVLTLISSKRMR